MGQYEALANITARGRSVKRGEVVELTDAEAAVRAVKPVKKTAAKKRAAKPKTDDE